ncbi:hypothetical protein IV203_029917 [Nitzschia inconspicua]|uniref:Uncharacterized protein n=1 Tax=Nitzschia inconspicua TaxID=303405 RepID=A0A9K3LV60_9STRA|nr:hypothetical protein IV203_029917 [Nitzschia inconspicua]
MRWNFAPTKILSSPTTFGFSKYDAKYWAIHWPIVVDNLLAASCQTPKQKLVFCDNLYAYVPGRDTSPSMTKTVLPSLNIPGVRALIQNKFKEKMNERTSRFHCRCEWCRLFGPGITNLSFLGDTFTKAIVSGSSNKRPLVIGSCKNMHDFAPRNISPTHHMLLELIAVLTAGSGNAHIPSKARRRRKFPMTSPELLLSTKLQRYWSCMEDGLVVSWVWWIPS